MLIITKLVCYWNDHKIESTPVTIQKMDMSINYLLKLTKPWRDIGFAHFVRLVRHCRPSQINDIKWNKWGLKQTRIRLMLLNHWQHRGHTQNDTQNQVETDEKFVKPAVSSVYSCVIAKTETNANQTSNVKENSSR